MQNNIYVDTNIVVDMCDNKRALYDNSFEVITNYFEEDACELFINSDTLATLFYILSNRSTLNTDEVLEKMSFINEIFTLVSIESDDVMMALELCASISTEHKDYEDAMQYVCAKKVNANLIITNDKGFVSPDIKIHKTA